MKLIRPRTPGLPPDAGSRPVNGNVELEILIRAKVMEEAAEAAAATSREELVSELGDLYEAMTTLAHLNNLSLEDVKSAMIDKIHRKGALVNGILLTYDPKTTGVYGQQREEGSD